ncbi:hypothetical protein IscW_ISCW015957 [Ixodes scapularis]|uniref:Uncharacterized protein n=1 Tax=Ixodes scapularis TaxID=6945 RepID=B7P2I0_IXOSC|nr:hypothetical protein IscW_ISCW015957 [Ixodes scapularis]|eukprot:XP_002402381.1 hypothetical protein IscW_ISCW015957 [Ixodes scapularis]
MQIEERQRELTKGKETADTENGLQAQDAKLCPTRRQHVEVQIHPEQGQLATEGSQKIFRYWEKTAAPDTTFASRVL